MIFIVRYHYWWPIVCTSREEVDKIITKIKTDKRWLKGAAIYVKESETPVFLKPEAVHSGDIGEIIRWKLADLNMSNMLSIKIVDRE